MKNINQEGIPQQDVEIMEELDDESLDLVSGGCRGRFYARESLKGAIDGTNGTREEGNDSLTYLSTNFAATSQRRIDNNVLGLLGAASSIARRR